MTTPMAPAASSSLSLLTAGLSLSASHTSPDHPIPEIDLAPLIDAERTVTYSQRGNIDGIWVATQSMNGSVRYTHPNLPNVFVQTDEVHPRLNGLCPVMRLPKELLIEIFYRYILLIQQDAGSYIFGSGKNSFPQVTLSHVCTKWRNIVNNLPELWTIVDTCSLEFVQLMLARGGDFPVYLRVREPQGRNRFAMRDWLKHASLNKDRIEYVEYWPTSDPPEDQVMCLLSFVEHATQLKSLTYYSSLPAVSPVVIYQLNENSDPPPVEYLTCYGPRGASSLCSSFARTLTRLHMSGFARTEFSRTVAIAEYIEFSCALNATPNLTHLELADMDFSALSGRMVEITLPNLQNLHIWDKSTSMFHMLISLQFPPTTELLLECQESSPLLARDLLRLVIPDKIVAVHHSPAAPKFATLDVGFQPRGFIRAWTSTDTSKSPHFMFTLAGDLLPTPQMNLSLASLLGLITPLMPNVTKLMVGPWGEAPLSPEKLLVVNDTVIWRILQDNLRNVQQIHWSRTSNHKFHQVLLGPLRNPVETDIAFPHLRRLTLKECAFMCDTCDCGEHLTLLASPGTETAASICTHFRDVVKLRQQQGKEKLDWVRLDHCVGLCRCSIERMKGLAETVDIFPALQ